MTGMILLLEIDGRRAALPAEEVHSVIEPAEIYPVPRAPAFVVGLTALRSRSLTVIDCRSAIGLAAGEQRGANEHGRAPVVTHEGHQYALLVDGVDDVVEAASEVTPVPGGFGPGWASVARGMVETDRGPALLIDIATLIAGPAAAAA